MDTKEAAHARHTITVSTGSLKPLRTYKREPVNWSQMGIKRKTCDFQTSIYFRTYPPQTLIHLSHRFTSALQPAAKKSSDCCLSHFRTRVSTSSSSAKRLPPSCEALYAINTFRRKHEIFLYESFTLSPFAH
jgi:hypothetical protein